MDTIKIAQRKLKAAKERDNKKLTRALNGTLSIFPT
jgi:hypothetical protein